MANHIDLSTEDNLQYTFYPVSSGSISFKIRAPHDAHIALTTGPGETEPMYEVFIGGWVNTKSVIRKNRQKPEKIEVETPGILNAGEFRGFWIRWDCGIIAVGREDDAVPIMSWEDPEPFPVAYFGVCTGWGASGTWKIEASPSRGASAPSAPYVSGGGQGVWVDAARGEVPTGAVIGGQDGEPMYVARAQHEGALLPGKLIPSHGVAYVPWGGGEHGKEQYQVFCGNANWVPTNGAALPPNALPSGETEDGEPLFVGRVNHQGTLTVGKVQPSHGVCYIAFGGQELGFQDYDVLVQ